MVLFCNYKTHTVITDKEGKKRKAQGGERVMYTSHNPCWDAKNRDGLPEILPLAYEPIAHIFGSAPAQESVQKAAPEPEPVPESEPAPVPTMPDTLPTEQIDPKEFIPEGIPKELADLMRQDNISDYEIQFVVSQEGYCPPDMPISAYPPDFIKGWIIAGWENVKAKIKEMNLNGVPF